MAIKQKQQDGTSKEGKVGDSDSNNKAIHAKEVRQESSKAAHAAMSSKKRSKELKDAAAGATDPDERQKLMEQAIDAQIEAESFGKTAKYMRSGAFQGLAVGTGLGVAPGATLGAVTGTLVGGVTSTVTGGLGGGIGTAAGALHGPIWNLGEVAGKGVRKFTGDLPGWVASDEQKRTLEKMMGQIQEEDMPDESELKTLHEEGGSATADAGWMQSVRNMLPSMGGANKSSESTKQDISKTKSGQADGATQEKLSPAKGLTRKADTNDGDRKEPRKLEAKSNDSNARTKKSTSDRKQPQKLETNSNNKDGKSAKAERTKRQPRKLESRS